MRADSQPSYDGILTLVRNFDVDAIVGDLEVQGESLRLSQGVRVRLSLAERRYKTIRES